MIIVLEGNECCFKSTVADKLRKKLGFKVIQGSSFSQAKCTQAQLFQKFISMILGKTDLIIDRYVYSNLVYGYLYKDFALIDPSQQKLIESLMAIEQVKVFYLYADSKTIVERLKIRGDEYIEPDVDKIEQILHRYEDILHNTMYSSIELNTTLNSSNQIADFIIKQIKYKC